MRRLWLKSMDVLIDTNVIMNFLTERGDPFQASSDRIMELCDTKRLNGYVAFHSLSTIWYVIRKTRSDKDARYLLEIVCKILKVASATHEQVMQAIADTDFRDFEDCLQDRCAQNVGAEFLITCNIKDFRYAKTRAVTPQQMLDMLPSY